MNTQRPPGSPSSASPGAGTHYKHRRLEHRRSFRPSRLMLVGLFALLPAFAGWGTAASAAPTRTTALVATGWLRIGHFAPTAGTVDVFIDSKDTGLVIGFKQVTNYISVPAGVHNVELRTPGSSTADLQVQAGVGPGAAVTVGAVTTRNGLAGEVYDDAMSPPPAGQAEVRFVHTAPDVAPVTASIVGGPVLAASVSYPSASPYQTVAPGTYNVVVSKIGSPAAILNIAGWKISAGQEASVVIVQDPNGALDVVPVTDGGAPTVTPTGSPQTGFGGMAHETTPGTVSPPAILAGAVALVAGAVAWRRRRHIRFARAHAASA